MDTNIISQTEQNNILRRMLKEFKEHVTICLIVDTEPNTAISFIEFNQFDKI